MIGLTEGLQVRYNRVVSYLSGTVYPIRRSCDMEIRMSEHIKKQPQPVRRERSYLRLIVLMLLFCGVFSSVEQVLAAPEPSPRAPRWEMQFKIVHQLRLIKIDDDFYWFATYLVTNKTSEDQTFVPNATLYTDAGDIITDGNIDFHVTDTIFDLLGNPLLESKNQIIGPLLQGKENAREGLLLWKAGSLDIDHLTIFISGLSSETQVAINAYTGDESVVRKTLALEYDVPGDPVGTMEKPVRFKGRHWIMR